MPIESNPFAGLKPTNYQPRNVKSEETQLRYYYSLPIAEKTRLSRQSDRLITAEIRRDDVASACEQKKIDTEEVYASLNMLPESFRPHKHEGPKQFIDRIRRVSEIEMSVSMKHAEIQRLNQDVIQRIARLDGFEREIQTNEGSEEIRLKKRDDNLMSASSSAESSSFALERSKQQLEILGNILDGLLGDIERQTSELQFGVQACSLILHVAEIGSTGSKARELLDRECALEAWFAENADFVKNTRDLELEEALFPGKVVEKKRAQSAGAGGALDSFRLLKEELVLEYARKRCHLDDPGKLRINLDFKQYVEGLKAYIKPSDIEMPRIYGERPVKQPEIAPIPKLNMDRLRSGATTELTSCAISRNSSRLSSDLQASSCSALKTSRTGPKQREERPPRMEQRETSQFASSRLGTAEECSGQPILHEIVSGLLASEPHLVFEHLNINEPQIDFRISEAIETLRQSADLNPVKILSNEAEFAQNITLLEQQNLVRTQNIQNVSLQIEQGAGAFASENRDFETGEGSLRRAEAELRQKIATYRTLYDRDFGRYAQTVESFIYDFSQFEEPDEIRLDRLETELLVIDAALLQAGVNARIIPKYDPTVAPKSIMTQYEKEMNILENQYVAHPQAAKDGARRELGKRRREETRAAKAREFQNAGAVNEEKERIRKIRMERQQIKARKIVPRCFVTKKHKTQAQLELEARLRTGAEQTIDEEDFYV